MAIIPAFILSALSSYLEPLLHWFSDQTYAILLPHADDQLLHRLHTTLDFTPLEHACAAYHHTTGPGAPPTHPASRLLRALLVGYLFHWSTRQLEMEIHFNLLVKWFVGYAVFELGPDHSTLDRFEFWVCLHQPRTFFDEMLHQIDARFPHEREQAQIGDTFALQADAAKESLIELLRHTGRRLLVSLQQIAPRLQADIETQLHSPALFGTPDEPTPYRLSPAERLARLQTTVLAARTCADWVRRQLATAPIRPVETQRRVTVWLERLDKIVADEVEITTPSDEGAVQVTPLPDAKKGSYRLGSATDPEATYRVHGAAKTDFGYNVQVAVTDHFVREIQVEPGAQPDGVAIPDVLCAEKEFQDLVPPKFIYDAAAGAGKTRARVAEATHGQTQLVAPLAPKHQPPTPFPPEQFTLSADGRTLSCPGGQTTDIAYGSSSAEGRNFRFLDSHCADCPLWPHCRTDQLGAKTRRRVFISDYRQEIEAARAYNQTAEYQADLQQRPRVERIISA